DVAWHPARPRVGDVAWLHVRNVPEAATVEGSVDGRSLTFFPYAGGQAALVGIDLEAKPGVRPWRIAVVERGREPRPARGAARFEARGLPVEPLPLPRAVVDLGPEAGRRGLAEAERLAVLLTDVQAALIWSSRSPSARPQ